MSLSLDYFLHLQMLIWDVLGMAGIKEKKKQQQQKQKPTKAELE